jgi:hypothetical protein
MPTDGHGVVNRQVLQISPVNAPKNGWRGYRHCVTTVTADSESASVFLNLRPYSAFGLEIDHNPFEPLVHSAYSNQSALTEFWGFLSSRDMHSSILRYETCNMESGYQSLAGRYCLHFQGYWDLEYDWSIFFPPARLHSVAIQMAAICILVIYNKALIYFPSQAVLESVLIVIQTSLYAMLEQILLS